MTGPMTVDDAKKLLQKTTFTLKGRIFHPNILIPKKGTKPEDREKFDVQFVWKNNENAAEMAKINKFMMDMTQVLHPGVDPRALINPFKRFETYLRQDGKPNGEHLRDCIWINPTTGAQFPPQVVKQGAMGTMVQLTPNDDAEAYSGRNAVISVTFYASFPNPEKKNFKRGFGLNFNAVMLLEGGDRLQTGSANAVDANQIFGQFAQDMGMTSHSTQIAQPTQQTSQPAAQQQSWPPSNTTTTPDNGGGFI